LHDNHECLTADGNVCARARARFSTRELQWVRETLRERDCDGGPARCKICGVTESEHEIVVDHMDGDKYNNQKWNLRFLCKSCNLKEQWRIDRDRLAVMTGTRQGVSERELDADAARERLVFAGALEGNASAEVLINCKYFPFFKSVLMQKILQDGFCSVKYAKWSLAFVTGRSPTTCERWYKVLASERGPLYVEERPTGDKVLKIKDSYWLQIEQVAKKVPVKDSRSLDEFVKQEGQST